MSWPTTDGDLFRSLEILRANALIVFIGELTDYSCNPPFLGACATDEFFEAVEEVPGLTAQLHYPTPRLDQIEVYRRR